MGTGFSGTFVISWTQTELDGLTAAPQSELRVGTAWRWTGEALRVDGPAHLLRLGVAIGETEFRARVMRGTRRFVGAPTMAAETPAVEDMDVPFETGLTLTDGRRTWALTLVQSTPGAPPLLMARDDLPPKDVNLWVVSHTILPHPSGAARTDEDAVVCFTSGTRILCEHGERPVESLWPGDKIQTRDNGLQTLIWLGERHISGARLMAHPELAPVTFAPGALEGAVGEGGLSVSPDHRMLIGNLRTKTLWNESEVMIRARDLLGQPGAARDFRCPSVSYYHLYLPSHEVIYANGAPTESFHPAFADLSHLSEDARADWALMDPEVARAPSHYGAPVRRMLTGPEAHVLTHA